MPRNRDGKGHAGRPEEDKDKPPGASRAALKEKKDAPHKEKGPEPDEKGAHAVVYDPLGRIRAQPYVPGSLLDDGTFSNGFHIRTCL